MWLSDLKISVAQVNGTCRSQMKPGDAVVMRGERLQVIQGSGFCLYALNAVLPYLLARQRELDAGDWLKFAPEFDCPEADRTVRMTIEVLPTGMEGLPPEYEAEYLRTLSEGGDRVVSAGEGAGQGGGQKSS